MADNPKQSKGHLVFTDDFEFLHGPDGALYRAPLSCPIGLNGYRQGARFECMPRSDGHKAHMKTVWNINLEEN